mgnify:CR=1 FL=1
MPPQGAKEGHQYLWGVIISFFYTPCSFRTIAKPLLLFKKKTLKRRKKWPPGVERGPQLFSSLESYYFCDFGAHAKFRDKLSTFVAHHQI